MFPGRPPIKQDCPACIEENVKRREEVMRQQEEEDRLKWRMSVSNIPKRFRGYKFGDIDLSHNEKKEDNQKLIQTVKMVKGFLKTFKDQMRRGASGFFCGECGTGKTMLACIIAENVIQQGFSAHYTTAWQMIQRIRQGYQNNESTVSYIKDFINYDLLVIDEIGVQHGSSDERVLLYQVIDGRYNEVKPTILISNSKDPVEDGYLDLRTIDRLKDGGGFSITFNGDSFRK